MTRFRVSHRKDGKFAPRGLRSYFEYRDLGIKRATQGKVVAHVIRARAPRMPMAVPAKVNPSPWRTTI